MYSQTRTGWSSLSPPSRLYAPDSHGPGPLRLFQLPNTIPRRSALAGQPLPPGSLLLGALLGPEPGLLRESALKYLPEHIYGFVLFRSLRQKRVEWIVGLVRERILSPSGTAVEITQGRHPVTVT